MTPRKLFPLAMILAALPAFAAEDAPADKKVSYYQQIRPIFQAHCHGCHQPAKASGDYVMTSFEKMIRGGESGSESLVPGKPDVSFLVELITSRDPESPRTE